MPVTNFRMNSLLLDTNISTAGLLTRQFVKLDLLLQYYMHVIYVAFSWLCWMLDKYGHVSFGLVGVSLYQTLVQLDGMLDI